MHCVTTSLCKAEHKRIRNLGEPGDVELQDLLDDIPQSVRLVGMLAGSFSLIVMLLM